MQAAREQAELAALNERERQDLEASSPADANGGGLGDSGALVQSMYDLMRATQVESMLKGCRDVNQYEKLNMISQGTYGIVYRCALELLSFESFALCKGWQLLLLHGIVYRCTLSGLGVP